MKDFWLRLRFDEILRFKLYLVLSCMSFLGLALLHNGYLLCGFVLLVVVGGAVNMNRRV